MNTVHSATMLLRARVAPPSAVILTAGGLFRFHPITEPLRTGVPVYSIGRGRA